MVEEFIEHFNTLNEEDKKSCNRLLINKLMKHETLFPEKLKTYEFYYNNLRRNHFNIEDIPYKYRDYNMYKLALEDKNNYDFFIENKKIPKEFLTKELYLGALETFKYSSIPEKIPKEFMDYDFCSRALEIDSGFYKHLPEEFKCDNNLIKIASKSKSDVFCSFIVCIPDFKKTKKICLNASKNFSFFYDLKHVPGRCITKNFLFGIKHFSSNGEDDGKLSINIKKMIKYSFVFRAIEKNNVFYGYLGFSTRYSDKKYKHKKCLSYYTF
jgi:hypothetical protein